MAGTSEKKGKSQGPVLTEEDKRFIAIDQLGKEKKKATIKTLSPDDLIKYRKFRDKQRLEKAQETINRIKSKERKADTRFKIFLGGWLIQKSKELQIKAPGNKVPLESLLKLLHETFFNRDKKNENSWEENLPNFIKELRNFDKIHHEYFLKKINSKTKASKDQESKDQSQQ